MTYEEYEVIVEKLNDKLNNDMITEETANGINDICYERYIDSYIDEICNEYNESTALSRHIDDMPNVRDKANKDIELINNKLNYLNKSDDKDIIISQLRNLQSKIDKERAELRKLKDERKHKINKIPIDKSIQQCEERIEEINKEAKLLNDKASKRQNIVDNLVSSKRKIAENMSKHEDEKSPLTAGKSYKQPEKYEGKNPLKKLSIERKNRDIEKENKKRIEEGKLAKDKMKVRYNLEPAKEREPGEYERLNSIKKK